MVKRIGTGCKEWSCGAWRPAGANKLFLTSIHHNRLPNLLNQNTQVDNRLMPMYISLITWW